MLIIADAHVHLYRLYRLSAALDAAARNLEAPADAVRALFLAERRDHDVFLELRDGTLTVAGWTVERTPEAAALVLNHAELGRLHVLAGRQVITREKLEILALLTDARFAEGEPIGDTVAAVAGAGGLPVLNWAPGKWLFARRPVVRAAIESATPGSLLLGDTSLRPACLPESRLMREGRTRGLTVLAGSDPLPFRGEESRIGSYGIAFECAFDPARPAASLRAALAASPGIRTVGRRPLLPTTALRLFRNEIVRRRGSSFLF